MSLKEIKNLEKKFKENYIIYTFIEVFIRIK